MDSLCWDNLRRRADGVLQHSASFDAIVGARPRQEFARQLLCNCQWADRPEFRCESAHALFGCAGMPVRIREMSPAKPLTAARAKLLSALTARLIHARDCLTELFLGFYGCCVHNTLHGARDDAAGKATQRARSTTPTGSTPLQTIYTVHLGFESLLILSLPTERMPHFSEW